MLQISERQQRVEKSGTRLLPPIHLMNSSLLPHSLLINEVRRSGRIIQRLKGEIDFAINNVTPSTKHLCIIRASRSLAPFLIITPEIAYE